MTTEQLPWQAHFHDPVENGTQAKQELKGLITVPMDWNLLPNPCTGEGYCELKNDKSNKHQIMMHLDVITKHLHTTEYIHSCDITDMSV
jgi:hypothetical protein